MNRILFVTSRNVINPCGELRLIKNRANALRDEFDIETSFCAFVSSSKMNKTREKIDTQGSFCVYTHSKNLVKTFLNYRKFLNNVSETIATGKFDAVILSGIFPTVIAKKLAKKFPDIKLIYDCHGANDELVEFHRGSRKFKLLFNLFERYEKKSLKYVNAVLAVSNALKDYIGKKADGRELQYFIVPCALTKQTVDTKQAQQLRIDRRKQFGIKDDELLFIYSGGVSAWQKTEAVKEMFDNLKKKTDKKCRLLMMSYNRDAIERFKDTDVIVGSYGADEVNEILYAGDAAFLLRDDYVTNNVAFPNKYLEYVRSGMYIITTPHVYDIAKGVTENGFGCTDEPKFSDIEKNVSLPWSEKLQKRQDYIKKYSFENTLKRFSGYIKGSTSV